MERVETLSPDDALRVWTEHIRSIEDSLERFQAYTLPDTWITRKIVDDLREALDVIAQHVENHG